MKNKNQIVCAILLCGVALFAAGGVSPLIADTVLLKNGRTISNVRVKIRSGGVFVRYPDGKSESFPIRQLNRVQMGAVLPAAKRPRPTPGPQAPATQQEAESPSKAIDQAERDRVAEASVNGDTWQPLEESQTVQPWGNFAAGLIPVYSGLYRTGSTQGGIAFSILEAALLVNALDFATATRDNHVWNRYDTLASGIFLYDFTQDGVLIPGISGPALLYLNGGLSNQVTDIRGGVTGRRVMRAQAADFPPFSKQDKEFRRLKRQAYSMLALALVADGFVSYLSATDFNLGQWSGPRSKRPTTPTGRALRSLILPGWGQYYSDQTLKGTIFAGTGAALVIASGLQSYKFRRAKQAHQSSVGDNLVFGGVLKLTGYNDETGYLITRAIGDPLRANVDREQANYQKILGLTAAFWIYNVVDALLGPGSSAATDAAHFSIAPVIETAATETKSTQISAGLQAGVRFLF